MLRHGPISIRHTWRNREGRRGRLTRTGGPDPSLNPSGIPSSSPGLPIPRGYPGGPVATVIPTATRLRLDPVLASWCQGPPCVHLQTARNRVAVVAPPVSVSQGRSSSLGPTLGWKPERRWRCPAWALPRPVMQSTASPTQGCLRHPCQGIARDTLLSTLDSQLSTPPFVRAPRMGPLPLPSATSPRLLPAPVP